MIEKMKNSNVTYKDVIRFAAHYWRRHARFGAGAAALMFTATAIDALVPVYVGKIVDALAQGAPGNLDSYGRAMQFFFVFLIISLVFHLLRAGSMYLWNIFAIRNLYEIVSESMQKVQRFSADWHANSFAGATVRKITRGMWSFDVFEDTLFMGLMPAVVITVAMCAMLILKLPEVGLFASFMVLLYAIFSILMSIRVLAPLFRESARADTKMGATLADIMTGIPTIKAFGAEEREDGLFREVSTLWRRRAIKSWQTAQTVDLSRGLLRVVMMTGMILLTIWMWKQGRSSPGDIALALTSFFIIGGYLRDVGMHITNLQKSVSEMEDAISFWLQDTEVRDASGAPAIRISQGGITFDNVTFAYKGQERPTFAGFNIDIRPGEKIALVGPSGSGKSTFIKLIQRLYDVQGGRILIDGQDIAAVTQESLRRHIALVPQDPILFHRSLAVNIAYGRPGAGLAEIEDAARKAYAHDFITALPQG